jgi:transposase-like protein
VESKTTAIGTSVTASEKAAIYALARRRGVSVSQLLRDHSVAELLELHAAEVGSQDPRKNG